MSKKQGDERDDSAAPEGAEDLDEASEAVAEDPAGSAADAAERDSDSDASEDEPVRSASGDGSKGEALERRPKTKRKRKRERPLAPPLSEKEIDSPSKQTLGMLSVVAAATLVMWGVGRAKCNYREIGEGMKPRHVTLQDRTHTPKDIAFAFQHALQTYDFSTAEKLATGAAKTLVEKEKSACAADCRKKHESLSSRVTSASELLKRTPSHALARVWSQGGDGASGKHLAVLKRDARDWKVETYEKDEGQKVDLPGDMPVPAMPPAPAAGLGSRVEPGAPSAPSSHPVGRAPAGPRPERPEQRMVSPKPSP